MRAPFIAIALAFAAAAPADPALVDCGSASEKPFNKRTDMERAWRQIAVHCYDATEDTEVREIEGAFDPNGWVATEGQGLVLLGTTIRGGTTAKAFQMEDHGEKVGATLVVYWKVLDDARTAAPEHGQRQLSATSAAVTLSAPTGGGWALGSGSFKVTTGMVQALYLRDCSKAACPTTEQRPELGDLRLCEMPRCGVPPPVRERFYRVLDRTYYSPTLDATLERIDGAQINELFSTTYRTNAVLGKSAIAWTGEDPAALLEQARRVGATRVLWWVEREREEHAVYLRDCSVAPCGSP